MLRPGWIHAVHGLRATREGLDDGDQHVTHCDAGRFTVGDLGAHTVARGQLQDLLTKAANTNSTGN